MLKILKALWSALFPQAPVISQSSEPSQEQLDHYWAELEILKSGGIGHPTDPHDVVPVPTSAFIRDGEYWGHPLNSFEMEPQDIIPFLEVHRDQSLWYSVISGLNYDDANTCDIIEWILDQSDCDALNAIKAFDYLEGAFFCGKHEEDGYANRSKALSPLKLITARERAGQHYVVELECDYRSRGGETVEELIASARREMHKLKADERPILEIPEITLLAGGKGAKPVEEFSVDETGILVLAKGQAEMLG